jgi:D-alanine-D-alanine ligase
MTKIATTSSPRLPLRRKPLRVLYACNVRPPDTGDEQFFEWEDPADAEAVMNAMRAAGCIVEPYQVKSTIHRDLSRLKRDFDIVFNNVETVPGMDLGIGSRESVLPFYCQSLDIPFTGSDFRSLTLAMDKRLTKAVAVAAGIHTPRTYTDTDTALARVRFPAIVKPAAEGSSMGIDDRSVAMNRTELSQAIARVRAQYRDAWLVEDYVRGPELAMGVLGNCVLDPVAVDLPAMPGNPLVRSHVVKHQEIDFVIRPELPAERLAELKAATWRMHQALGARHYNRMEFIDDGSRFWLIEVNPLPDISAQESFLAVAAGYWGIDFDTMISLVLLNAVDEYAADPEHAARFTADRVSPLREFVAPGLRALAEFGAPPAFPARNGRNGKNGKSGRNGKNGQPGQSERHGSRAAVRAQMPATHHAGAPANAGARGR